MYIKSIMNLFYVTDNKSIYNYFQLLSRFERNWN